MCMIDHRLFDKMMNKHCDVDIVARLKMQAIATGKTFKVKTQECLDLPGQQCGFRRSVELKNPVNCRVETDFRAVVSLALIKKQSAILGTYANKLPIMTMNVSRYLYTVEAFNFQNTTKNSLSEAINFLITTDIKYREKCQANLEFSNFLHRLRSSGYTEYIFELARKLNLNVDLVLNRAIVIRYINISNNKTNKSTSIGFLTAIRDADKWYVKTTKLPIVTNSFI